MIGKVKRRYFRENKCVRKIVRLMSLSRNTVRKWLKAPVLEEPRYRRSEAPGKFTPFHEAIKQALKVDAHRPRHERRTARALHAQIKSEGYAGSYSRVTDSDHERVSSCADERHGSNRDLLVGHENRNIEVSGLIHEGPSLIAAGERLGFRRSSLHRTFHPFLPRTIERLSPVREVGHAVSSLTESALVPSSADVAIASALVAHVAQTDAHLLVMGGFGHTRSSEFVLGGVSRTVLESMTLPALMSY